jgi:hypothetical protein
MWVPEWTVPMTMSLCQWKLTWLSPSQSWSPWLSMPRGVR